MPSLSFIRQVPTRTKVKELSLLRKEGVDVIEVSRCAVTIGTVRRETEIVLLLNQPTVGYYYVVVSLRSNSVKNYGVKIILSLLSFLLLLFFSFFSLGEGRFFLSLYTDPVPKSALATFHSRSVYPSTYYRKKLKFIHDLW